MNSLARCLIAVSLCLAACAGDEGVEKLLSDLKSPQAETRQDAVRALLEADIRSDEVRSALEAAASDEDRDVRRLACQALGEFGAGDTRVLEGALEDEEMSVRLAAAYALLKIDADNTPAHKVLSGAMESGDGGVIVQVTSKGPSAAWAVPTLTKLLKDRRPGIRRLAAEGLGKIGKDAESALEALERAKQDRDDRVRDAAAEAVRLIRGR
jgi:HEAT repeat protein